MTLRTIDGGIIPSQLKSASQIGGSRFGLLYGSVVAPVFPDEEVNITGSLEYIVNINGQDHFGVRDATVKGGGIFSNHRRTRRGYDSIKPDDITTAGSAEFVYEEKNSGEKVLCLFLNGNSDNLCFIVGSVDHNLLFEKNPSSKPSKDDGEHERYEFQGLEFLIDKESNFSIKHIGRKLYKDAKSTIENPEAVDTKITLKGNGDIELDIDADDLKAEWIKAEKLFRATHDKTIAEIDGTNDRIHLQVDKDNIGAGGGDSITISKAEGVQISTPAAGGTALSMKGGKIAFGSPSPLKAELLDLFDQTIDQIVQTETACAAIIVPTILGPSGPPINAATFGTIATNLGAIKTLLAGIKGTL